MQQVSWGWLTLAGAAVGFGFAGANLGLDLASNVGFYVAAVGYLLAMWASRKGRDRTVGVGAGIAMLGSMPFFLGFFPLQTDATSLQYTLAMLLYLGGLATVCVTYLITGRPNLAVVVGAGLVSAAGLYWIFLDGIGGGWAWEPGNVLAFIGGGWVAWATGRAT